ncbi:MAG: hypothetical protein E7321_08875 [Clostridiales bacterium]|nr:hypothetical protein [Clostridiales bacterium]
MAGYGYNPFGGMYGQPTPQMMAQQAYAQQMQGMGQAMPQQAQPQVITRMVTSRDEATTAQIQFDANVINVFLNLGAGEVYIKRFNPNTGGAIFDDFLHPSKLQQMVQQQAKPAPEYATVEMVQALEAKVGELAEAVSAKRKRGATTDE